MPLATLTDSITSLPIMPTPDCARVHTEREVPCVAACCLNTPRFLWQGLAFFEAGLLRSRNILALIMQARRPWRWVTWVESPLATVGTGIVVNIYVWADPSPAPITCQG